MPESDKSVIQKWSAELSRPEPILFTIDDNTTLSFIEIKTRFTEPKYTVNSTVTIEVLVRYFSSFFREILGIEYKLKINFKAA